MESLSRFAERAGAAVVLAAVVLVGCSSVPDSAPAEVVALPVPVSVGVMIQSIPRGAWIEVDGGYVGTGPVMAAVEVSSSGRPRRAVRIRATDVGSGAFEEKVFYGRPMPEKVLFDLRPLILRPEVLTF